jgi:hypothetical protein
MIPRFLLPCLLVLFAALGSAHAQLTVSLQLPRTAYLLDEPIQAILSITNLAGRDILLEDTPEDGPWCLIQVRSTHAGFVRPRKSDLSFPPLPIPAGQTVSRSIDLVECFEINETGSYKIRACVNFSPTHSQIWSQPLSVTTDCGTLLWSQTVGVPEGRPAAGSYRTFSLVSQRRPNGIFLYAKLEEKETGARFPAYPLGRMLSAMPPQTQIDPENNLYIFHAASDSSYLLSQIDVATGRMGQAAYRSVNQRKGRPSLRKNPDGLVALSGAIRVDDQELVDSNAPARAKITDRPAGF